MPRLLRYLATLDAGRTALWCYALWYVSHVVLRFDPSARLWGTSLGLSAIIGTALVLSTRARSGAGRPPLDRWVVFRLFLMPFCVSSFAALVKDHGYVLVFAPEWADNLPGLAAIASFGLAVQVLRRGLGTWERPGYFPTEHPDPKLLQAYCETLYHVLVDPPFALRIGTPSEALRALHAAAGVTCSAFVTACNPGSQQLADSTNAQRMQVLRAHLQEQGWVWREGRGVHPSNGWPAEPSCLVLGMPREVARRLAARYEQLALVWIGADGRPELVWSS